ncbi:MAG: class I SAM-dependent methyltransferase [Verrucomicrobiota bacterium]
MYTSLEAQLHDPFWNALGPPAELPLLLTFLEDAPARILYLGSGSGRLFLPLLEKLPLEALDPSPDMNTLLRQNASQKKLTPIIHQTTLADFQPSSPYHAILIPTFTFQLLPDPLTAIQQIHHLLLPGGRLYLTAFKPLAELNGDLPLNEPLPEDPLTLPDGSLAELTITTTLTKTHLTRHHHFTLTPTQGPPQTHQTTQHIRYFADHELESLLQKNGFDIDVEIIDFAEPSEDDSTAGISTFFAHRRQK